jgi:hypothetical protein
MQRFTIVAQPAWERSVYRKARGIAPFAHGLVHWVGSGCAGLLAIWRPPKQLMDLNAVSWPSLTFEIPQGRSLERLRARGRACGGWGEHRQPQPCESSRNSMSIFRDPANVQKRKALNSAMY